MTRSELAHHIYQTSHLTGQFTLALRCDCDRVFRQVSV